MIKKIVWVILGLLLIFGSYSFAKRMSTQKKEWQPITQEEVATGVFVEEVYNTNNAITIDASGYLQAKTQIDIFSEAQGVFLESRHPFKAGTFYRKGEVLLQLDKSDEILALKAQKSNFYNQLVLLMPDLKIDFPAASRKWNTYIKKFDFNNNIPPLPSPRSEKEKLFLSVRNIYSTFYTVKNLENKLKHFTIKAPFSGVLTEALVHPGALIRPGQKLGVFIDDKNYEVEVAVQAKYEKWLKIGKRVSLGDLEKTNNWAGEVVRINSRVDATSQTIPAFIAVKGKDLKEGRYMEAKIVAKRVDNSYEINRQLLVANNQVFVVQSDETLALMPIEPVFYKDNTVIVQGLADGTKLLAKMIPGAHVGMKVKVFEDVLQ